MMRAWALPGLLLLVVSSSWAEGLLDDRLKQAGQRSLAGKAPESATVIIESAAPAAAVDALRRRGFMPRFAVNGRFELQLDMSRLAELATALPVGAIVRPSFPHEPHVVSQGVDFTGAGDMHALDAQGAGVKIGVIDMGFGGLGGAQSGGELPVNLSITDYTGTGTGGTNHGTQVAQIVHDMAPQGQLYLAKINTDVQLQQAVNDMVAAGVQVINHSVGWYAAAFYDGSGPICDSVNVAASNGIVWVNSAGNDRLRHYLGTFTDANGDLSHEFTGSQDYNTISLGAGASVTLVLNWDDYPSTGVDYDLYLYSGDPNSGGAIIARSENRQSGRGVSRFPYPHEIIDYTSTNGGIYYIVVKKSTASTGHLPIALFSLGPNLVTRTTASSLSQPADCVNALSVGAVNLTDGPESFSAEGPTTDGRAKPELVAPNRVVTSLSSGFAGTSAASPHVAGAVALAIEQLGLSPRQAADYLLTTLWDVHIDGFDFRTGGGRLSHDADGDGHNHDADNCPLEVNLDQADLDGDNIGDACDDDIDGDGLSGAQESLYGTNAYSVDTDGDGIGDYDEIFEYGTDPLASDTDSDGVSDHDEIFVYFTDPRVGNLVGDLSPRYAPDGVVDAADYMLMLRIVLGAVAATPELMARGDIYPMGAPDGVIDLSDLIELRKRVPALTQ